MANELLTDMNDLDIPNDVIIQIQERQKPGDVAEWWDKDVKPHKLDWAGPLTGLEQRYVDTFTSKAPSIIQMRAPVDANNLTPEEHDGARRLFGTDSTSVQRFASFETRRRIVWHYVMTHPAILRAELGLYRFIRDINPVHFAFERGWQIATGNEMFTDDQVSRLGAAAEFFAFIAVQYGVSKILEKVKPTTGSVSVAAEPQTGPRWNPKRAGHIFRVSEKGGHINPSSATEAWNQIVEWRQVASDPGNFRADAVAAKIFPAQAQNAGVKAFTFVRPSGEQVWVFTIGDEIVDAGVNLPGAHR